MERRHMRCASFFSIWLDVLCVKNGHCNGAMLPPPPASPPPQSAYVSSTTITSKTLYNELPCTSSLPPNIITVSASSAVSSVVRVVRLRALPSHNDASTAMAARHEPCNPPGSDQRHTLTITCISPTPHRDLSLVFVNIARTSLSFVVDDRRATRVAFSKVFSSRCSRGMRDVDRLYTEQLTRARKRCISFRFFSTNREQRVSQRTHVVYLPVLQLLS